MKICFFCLLQIPMFLFFFYYPTLDPPAIGVFCRSRYCDSILHLPNLSCCPQQGLLWAAWEGIWTYIELSCFPVLQLSVKGGVKSNNIDRFVGEENTILSMFVYKRLTGNESRNVQKCVCWKKPSVQKVKEMLREKENTIQDCLRQGRNIRNVCVMAYNHEYMQVSWGQQCANM